MHCLEYGSLEVYPVYSNNLKGDASGCRAMKPFGDRKGKNSASLANLALGEI